MIITTARCRIRDFTLADIEPFMAYRNDLDWMKYQGYKGKERQTYESDLLKTGSIYEGKQFAIALLTNDQLIGDIFLQQEARTFWLGYSIAPAYARKGYTHEVLSALLEWLNHQGVQQVKAGVLPENTASIRLLEKLGFVFDYKEDNELIYTYSPTCTPQST